MANRRLEMYRYRQILVCCDWASPIAELAKGGLIGRRKAGRLRDIAQAHGWLDTSSP